jgi:hypothetical protein
LEIIKKYKVLILFLVVIAVEAVWVFNSDGFYFIDDSCHFNYNRHFLETFTQSTGAWHRIGRVWLFALPAQFGLKGVQLASALIFMLTIYFAYRILKLKNVKYAEWVIPIIGFQPVLFNISFTSLAEVPAAFLIVLSYYFYLKDRYVLTMVLSSLIFIFRTEFYFIAGLFLLIYLYQKKWKAIPLFFIGPLLWYFYTTLITFNGIQFFYDMTLHSRLPRIDDGVDWYYYLLHSGKIFGFIQALFFVIGIAVLSIKKKISEYSLILLIIFGGIALHTLFALKGTNITCSIGQLRYVAVIGPMFGIISTLGISYFYEFIKYKYVRYFIYLILLLVMFILGPFSTPFHNKFEIEKISDRIVQTARTKYPGYTVLSNLHYIANSMDEPASGGKDFKNLTIDNLNKYDKSVIVWEKSLETTPFGDEKDKAASLSSFESRPDVKLVETIKDTVNNCVSAPIWKYRKEDYESKKSRDFIDYLLKDQTTWETIEVRVYVKN